MYRAVTLVALERTMSLHDAEGLAALAESLAIAFRDGRVFVDDRDVSTEIRTEQITTATRSVADAPPVRDVMKRMQRSIAEGLDVVTEGRDQGSVVFPLAELKVFLTASPEERALRRHREEASRGTASSLDSVLAAQNRRDEGDRVRAVGAMKAADDAVLVETDGLTQDEVVERLVQLIEERRRPRSS
jgi:cytidylate kinase